MPEPITWENERRKLGDLIPWDENPRQIRTDEARRLDESLTAFGQIHPIAIGPNNTILDGHQRQAVWSLSENAGMDFEVDVRVASRELTNAEHKKLVVYLHQGTVGEWDFDVLSNWDLDEKLLLDWGFSEKELGLGLDVEIEPPEPETDQITKACPHCGGEL